ncbi:MAG: DNA recombination protein RmuC [Treponema sp.]|nr:DNA recombination protein RmuC [Candidatus Treponema equifaecale]
MKIDFALLNSYFLPGIVVFLALFAVILVLLISQKNLRSMMNLMKEQLDQSQGNLNKSVSDSNALIGDIYKKLGNLEASTNHIQEIGKDISSLQNILRSPKLRGNLGEYLLYELLKDILPKSNYEIQHRFSDGLAVDAVVKLGKNLIPVDSKFPLESFQRYVDAVEPDSKKKFKTEFVKSVKGRVDEISKKYIRPAEGTFDFAMMYIPAENIYYEILINDSDRHYELFDYAMSHKVIPVSPNTFYAYLMAIVYGLRGFKIEKQAQTIINELSGVQNVFNDFLEDFAVLGKHLNNAGGKFNELNKAAVKINHRVGKITGAEMEEGLEQVSVLPIGDV